MPSHSSPHPAPKYRQPLSDTTEWVNNQSSTPAPSELFSTPQPHIPHHTSLKPGGNLPLPNPSLPDAIAEDKRVSAVSGSDRNANRDSQYSTASTDASKKSRRKRHVGPWHLGKTLGKGASGRVRVAKHAVTGQKAAIKIVSKKAAQMVRTKSLAEMDTIAAQSGQRLIPFGIEREVVIMKLIEHPNIISLYDVWENRGELYLVLEYVEGGELFHYISRNGRLDEGESVRIFRQMIAGLSYCHRFHICHRDLKPENILMDRHGNVKIVDFGMAALQPANKWLTTSCGSPHYASPEVIQAQQYQGDKADIWSCGIILYAMLTGTLPFDSNSVDHRDVCWLVIQGKYTFPAGLSSHAKDLIWRMLQYDPRRRIPMKRMWEHPLLRRYQNLDSLDTNGSPYIGPPSPLTLTDCGPLIRDRKDIDKELLRNIQSLWHGATDEEVAQKLLSDAPNHERILYSKLLQFREEHLENYEGPIMEYSVSDYHHAQEPPPRSMTRVSLQHGNRQDSRYSLLHEGLPPKSQSQMPRRQPSVAATEQSYDPYRPSSKRQMTKAEVEQSRITVVRGPSSSSRQRAISGHSRRISIRNPAVARVQDGETYSIPNSSSASGSPQQRQISRGASRRSMASNSSARAVARKSFSYKRNVSFVHPRRQSNPKPPLRTHQNASPRTLQERFAMDQEAEGAKSDQLPELPVHVESRSVADSPVPEASQVVRSKKTLSMDHPVPDIVLTRSSHYWKDDARKVSTELEKYIDEAFNRSSMQSNVTRETKETERSYNTPTTTLSQRDNSASSIIRQRQRDKAPPTADRSMLERPLPKLPPPEYPGTNDITQRELARARDLLKQRAADLSIKGSLDDVIAHLDRLMQPSAVRIQEQERRAASTPGAKSPLERRDDTFERFLQEGYTGIRSASEPVPREHTDNRGVRATVRMVEHSDDQITISPTKPLTIRKKSGSSTPSEGSVRVRSRPSQELVSYFEDIRPYAQASSGEYRSAGLSLLDRALEPIEEDDDKENFDPIDRKQKTLSGESKKRGWFRRGHHTQGSQEKDRIQHLQQASQPQEYYHDATEDRVWNKTSDPIEEFVQPELKPKGKGLFFKIFSKREGKGTKNPPQGSSGDYNLDETSDNDSVTTSTRHPSAYMSGGLQDPNPSTNSLSNRNSKSRRKTSATDGSTGVVGPTAPPRPIQPHPQNWLARFLRIRPATSIFCFHTTRLHALKAVAAVLREWRKYGIRDLHVDKSSSRIFATVGEKNSLRIKSVEFAGEFYEVLEKGRRVKGGLAVARLTQVRGAKSSFERVVKALGEVLGGRGVLVDETVEGERARGMKGVLET